MHGPIMTQDEHGYIYIQFGTNLGYITKHNMYHKYFLFIIFVEFAFEMGDWNFIPPTNFTTKTMWPLDIPSKIKFFEIKISQKKSLI